MYNRVEAQIRSILKGTDYLQVNVDGLAEDADLYAAGLNSHATVNLMLSLEEAFDIELPDRLLRRRTFRQHQVDRRSPGRSGRQSRGGMTPWLAAARAVGVEVASRHADDVDRRARFPAEAFAALKKEKLLGIAGARRARAARAPASPTWWRSATSSASAAPRRR